MRSTQIQRLRQIVDQLPSVETALNTEPMKPVGKWHEATVPDTLDLAHRAELAVNVMTSNVKPEQHYALMQGFRFDSQPPVEHSPNWMVMKFVRALPMMRVMCGSEYNLETERETMRAILTQIRADGQIYYPLSADGPPAETSYPLMNGITALALLTWHARDGNSDWLDWVRLVVEGLKDAVIHVDDYAYIPPECSLSADGRWHWTLRGGEPSTWPPGYLPYTPPEEPVSDQQGFEGLVKWEQSYVIKALVRAYALLGDEEALEQAWKLAHFCLRPGLWEDTSDDGYPGHEHGSWAGHLHGNMGSLQGLLSLAVASNDSRLKQIVREGYEHARRYGLIRLGWMPSWIAPERFGRPASAATENEGCGIADTLMLVVQLSDAGLGDYWDDVDYVVRNHLTELQVVDLDAMRQASNGGADYDPILKQFIGGFTQAALTANLNSAIYGCCTANGSRALYHAWEGITRFDQGVATVNLFLNRASAWIDVDSYLPYEGRVVLHNKRAHTALVRIPSWVDGPGLTSYINDVAVPTKRSGHYIVLEGLESGDTIRIQFAVPKTTERLSIRNTTFTVTFRGSTVVDIQPRETDQDTGRDKYPFFVRDHLRATKAPMRRVRRFVPEKLLPRF